MAPPKHCNKTGVNSQQGTVSANLGFVAASEAVKLAAAAGLSLQSYCATARLLMHSSHCRSWVVGGSLPLGGCGVTRRCICCNGIAPSPSISRLSAAFPSAAINRDMSSPLFIACRPAPQAAAAHRPIGGSSINAVPWGGSQPSRGPPAPPPASYSPGLDPPRRGAPSCRRPATRRPSAWRRSPPGAGGPPRTSAALPGGRGAR